MQFGIEDCPSAISNSAVTRTLYFGAKAFMSETFPEADLGKKTFHCRCL